MPLLQGEERTALIDAAILAALGLAKGKKMRGHRLTPQEARAIEAELGRRSVEFDLNGLKNPEYVGDFHAHAVILVPATAA